MCNREKCLFHAFWVMLELFQSGHSLRCYSCMGTQPGCSTEGLDWRLVKNMECLDPHDLCVKITEKILGSNLTTRGCLSMFTTIRRDIPADHYEGCRKGSIDIRLNKDVAVTDPHQIAIQSDQVIFCFCSWDNYCNSATVFKSSALFIFFMVIIEILVFR